MSIDPTEVVGEQVEWKSGVYRCIGYHDGPVYVLDRDDGHRFVASAGDVFPVMPPHIRAAAKLVTTWYVHEQRSEVVCPCCRACHISADAGRDAGVVR